MSHPPKKEGLDLRDISLFFKYGEELFLRPDVHKLVDKSPEMV